MLGLFDLIFLGANMVASITVTTTDIVNVPTTREAIATVSLKREWWREDGSGKCTFEGIMVPMVQDWDEVVVEGDHERIVKADPDKTVAQVILLNRKVCKGKEPEAIMRGAVFHQTKGYLLPGIAIYAGDLLKSRPGEVPKWFHQVVSRVERVAENDERAKVFLAGSHAELTQVAAIGDPFGNTALKTVAGDAQPSPVPELTPALLEPQAAVESPSAQ